MIRLFNVYFPIRTLLLPVCEAILVVGSFLLTTVWLVGPDAEIVLLYENGLIKIAVITVLTLFFSYYLDLYESQRMAARGEIYFRLMLVLGMLSFVLAAGLVYDPESDIGHGHNVLVAGIALLAVFLVLWRRTYEWLLGLSLFRERVYVLGSGARARAVAENLRSRRDAGMDVVGGAEGEETGGQMDRFASELRAFRLPNARLDRIVVALEDRRGAMPLRELLDLRLRGVTIENAVTLMERLSGKLQLDGLNPSNLIFTEGFNVRPSMQLSRRLVSIAVASLALAISLPFLPFIALAVRLSSPGPIFFHQTRVGLRGRAFSLHKFRTMRQNAEANGAVWAAKNDPRVTAVGRFLRKTRLDEIPQLWNVLCGDMGFVGPRPERPEFVAWLAGEIPFYDLRHMIPPGLTGWAQVRYGYGASLEETKQKLEYDLYYVKHMSIGLDLLIIFETIKTILLRRGSQ
jgi:sugar transferase (PEP-CTERM system associated)